MTKFPLWDYMLMVAQAIAYVGPENIQAISVSFSQGCREPKTALKNSLTNEKTTDGGLDLVAGHSLTIHGVKQTSP